MLNKHMLLYILTRITDRARTRVSADQVQASATISTLNVRSRTVVYVYGAPVG